jgi:hypothetical protein
MKAIASKRQALRFLNLSGSHFSSRRCTHKQHSVFVPLNDMIRMLHRTPRIASQLRGCEQSRPFFPHAGYFFPMGMSTTLVYRDVFAVTWRAVRGCPRTTMTHPNCLEPGPAIIIWQLAEESNHLLRESCWCRDAYGGGQDNQIRKGTLAAPHIGGIKIPLKPWKYFWLVCKAPRSSGVQVDLRKL